MSSVHEPKMGWGAGGLYFQHFTLNVGCAFFRPTRAAIGLMQRVSDALSRSSVRRWNRKGAGQDGWVGAGVDGSRGG